MYFGVGKLTFTNFELIPKKKLIYIQDIQSELKYMNRIYHDDINKLY